MRADRRKEVILDFLVCHGAPTKAVDIAKALGMTTMMVSSNLGYMRAAGLVKRRRVATGRSVRVGGRAFRLYDVFWSVAIDVPFERQFHTGGFVGRTRTPGSRESVFEEAPVFPISAARMKWAKAELKEIVATSPFNSHRTINVKVARFPIPRTDDMRDMLDVLERTEPTPRHRQEAHREAVDRTVQMLVSKSLERVLSQAFFGRSR